MYIRTLLSICFVVRIKAPVRDAKVIGYKARQRKKLISELEKEYEEIHQERKKGTVVSMLTFKYVRTYLYTYVRT